MLPTLILLCFNLLFICLLALQSLHRLLTIPWESIVVVVSHQFHFVTRSNTPRTDAHAIHHVLAT